MTKEIPLTQGKVAIVDDDVYEWAVQWKWCAHHNRHSFYARRSKKTGRSNKVILLHREIMNAPTGIQVDHKNGDGLDCRRNNLRLATNTENGQNSRRRLDNRSGYKGVSWHKVVSRWRARIKVDGVEIRLGYYDTPEEAALAYDEAARKYHGEFARTNF